MSSQNSNSSLALTPLGAGDLIDRAIRLYRNNFWTYIWIASPPILIGTLFSVAWILIGRALFGISSRPGSSEEFFSVFFSAVGNLLIWFFEAVAVMIVMGGASRNFVRHLLFEEPISFKETYKNAISRVFGLLGASLIIIFTLQFVGGFILYLGFIVLVLVVMLVFAAFGFSTIIGTIFSVAVGIAGAFGLGWLFALVASRFAYVPQVMLVEGQSVGAAISRSFTLASGNIKRIYALFIFTIVTTYSALLLFYVPLGWYAYANGIEILTSNPDTVPVWYMVATQVVSQLSLILLMPVWMIGLCLLYVDERVRHEGYDIELMAARNLGEIPAVPRQYSNPLQPALANQTFANNPPNNQQNNSITTLGLNG